MPKVPKIVVALRFIFFIYNRFDDSAIIESIEYLNFRQFRHFKTLGISSINIHFLL